MSAPREVKSAGRAGANRPDFTTEAKFRRPETGLHSVYGRRAAGQSSCLHSIESRQLRGRRVETEYAPRASRQAPGARRVQGEQVDQPDA
jgi:hypothetical protein